MQEFRNILVGVDLSSGDKLASTELGAPTKEAVRRGVWIGKALGSTVTFLAALDVSAQTEEKLHEGFADAAPSVETTARQVVAGLVDQAKNDGIDAHGVVVFGPPGEMLTKQVLRQKHDLVLVGTRDRGAVSRMLFGSTAIELMRECPCPVWVTRPDPVYEDVNMLVACDLGPETERMLRIAVGGGRLLDAKVHLIHAVELDPKADEEEPEVPRAPGETTPHYHRKALADADQRLRDALSHSDHRTLPYGIRMHVVEGDAEDVIAKAVNEHGIDLLVMGTDARSGLAGLFVGNSAERLLSQVECSLLVIKPEGFVSPVSAD